MEVHIAAAQRDLNRRAADSAFIKADHCQVPDVCHPNGDRAGHTDVAAARARLGVRPRAVGGIDQRLCRIASVAERDGLACQRIFARGCEFGAFVIDDNQVVGAAIGHACHVSAAAVAVAHGVAGTQVVIFTERNHATVAGVERDFFVAKTQQTAVFEFVPGACAWSGEVHAAIIAAGLGACFALVVVSAGIQRNGAVIAHMGVVGGAVVEAADLVARIVLVGDLVAGLDAVALADEHRVGVLIDHRHFHGFEADLALGHVGLQVQAIGHHHSTFAHGGLVVHNGHRHGHTHAHARALFAGDCRAIGRGHGIGQVARVQHQRAGTRIGASCNVDQFRNRGTRGGDCHCHGHGAGHTDRATGGVGAGGVGFFASTGFTCCLATVTGGLASGHFFLLADLGIGVIRWRVALGRFFLSLAPGYTGARRRVVDGHGAGAETHIAIRGDIALRGGHGGVDGDGQGNRNAHTGVARFGVARGVGEHRARVRRAGSERAAHDQGGTAQQFGAGVVVGHGHGHHRRDGGFASRATHGACAHRGCRAGSQRNVMGASQHNAVPDHGIGVGLAHVDCDRRANAHAAAAILLARGLGLVGNKVLGRQGHVAVTGDRDAGIIGNTGLRATDAHIDGQRSGHAGVGTAGA